jgi:hypothetical protein
MKKFLLIITLLLSGLNLYPQVKLNIWDKTPVGKTTTKVNNQKLPNSFESKLPSGEVVIYDKLTPQTFTFQTSDGKKIKHTPVSYKPRNGFGVVTYKNGNWTGYHQTGNKSLLSMSETKIFDDTSSYDAPPCNVLKMPSTGNTEVPTLKIPEVGRLQRTDFYDKTVPINKNFRVYFELTNDVHSILGNNTQTSVDWMTNMFLGLQQIFANEGITITLSNSYIWTTLDPYRYTLSDTAGSVLSRFSSNAVRNIPINSSSARFRHIITNKNYGGLAYLGYAASDGYNLPSTNGAGFYNNNTTFGINGLGSQTNLPSPSNLSGYFWPLSLIAHELGHSFSSNHTHWCGWINQSGNAIGRIDSCGSGYNEQGTGTINCENGFGSNLGKGSTVSTIMGYCHLYNPKPTNTLTNGFGPLPRFAMRSFAFYDPFTPFSNVVLPTVSTDVVSSITSSGFTCGGSISNSGGGIIISRGLVWSTSPNPTISSPNKQTLNDGTSSAFIMSPTTLLGSTTYYVRAFATNSAGTSYGTERQFTTLSPSIPSIVTLGINNISNTSARTGGSTILTNGAPLISKGIVYSTTQNPTISSTSKVVITTTDTSRFTTSLSGLNPSTTYYTRAFAQNSVGYGYGNQVSFTTFSSSTVIIVDSGSISQINPRGFAIGATALSDGGSPITSRGFCWNTSPTPTVSNSKTTEGSGTGFFFSNINNLASSTTYYIRPYVVNANGTFYGNERSVTTLQSPTSSILSVSVLTPDFFRVTFSRQIPSGFPSPTNGQVAFVEASFQSDFSGSILTRTTVSTSNVSGTATVSYDISSIQQPAFFRPTGATMYLRPFCVDLYGNRYYGQTSSVTIPPTTPSTIVASNPSSKSISTVSAEGYVTTTIGTSGGHIIRRGLVVSLSPSPTITNNIRDINVGGCNPDPDRTFSCDEPVISTISGLTPQRTYFARPYVISQTGPYVSPTNDGSTLSYGNEVSFTTPTYVFQGLPIVVLDSIRNITPLGAKIYGRVTNNGGSNCVLGSGCRGVAISATNGSPPASSCGLDANFNPLCWTFVELPNVQSIDGSFVIDFQAGNELMKPSTLYYVRLYATNNFGGNPNAYGYSAGSSFTTTNTFTSPLVTTSPPSSITNTTATSGGFVTSSGGSTVTARGVVWSTSPNPTTALSTKTSNGTGVGLFTSNITGLTANTLYYVRSYAVSSLGTGYGPTFTFTTNASVGTPVLTTSSVGLITTTTARSGGIITSDGGSSVTVRGICFSTSQNPSLTNGTVVTSGSGTGTYTSNLTGLVTGTTYFVRAFATNSSGTNYGNQVQFTTASVPTITTSTITNITSTTATSGGTSGSDGGGSILERGICYGTTVNPTTGGLKVVDGGISGTFSSTMTNLSPGTTYYVRAYSINSFGVGYGTQVSFTTLGQSSIPTVTTTAPSAITLTTATSGGNVTNENNASVTSRGVVWSTSPDPTISLTTKTNNGIGAGSFTSSLTNLSPGTTYYIRAYATNSIGTGYGSVLTFTTTSSEPIVSSTSNVTSITQTSAVSGGSITSDNGSSITNRGVVWSTSQNPTISLSTKTSDGTGIGQFSSTITGLTPSTLYYVRAFATNAIGTSYGPQVSFTSQSATTLATVNTTTATSITRNTATAGGQVVSDGGTQVTVRGVVWGTSVNPTVVLTTKTSDGTGVGTFTSTITGLSPSTLYYYRAYATNSNGTSYGSQLSFTSQSNLPTITTSPISAITPTSATSGGSSIVDGGASITQKGIVWSTLPNPTISLSTKTTQGTGTASFVSNMTNLTPGTLYYVRSYATNSAGTGYGNEITFTTSSLSLPTVSTATITNIQFTSAQGGGNVLTDGNSPVTARGVIWSTSPNPTVSLSTKTTNGTGLGTFTSDIINLTPGTFYYVRAYATNSVGTGYGDPVVFTATPGQSPDITTDLISSVTSNSATVTYSILSIGGGVLSTKGVCYSTNPSPNTSSPKVEEACAIETPCVEGQYTINITSLTPGTTYFVRAYGINEYGTAYGQELSFTTAILPPTVNTSSVTNITSNSAQSGGSVSNTGGGIISAKGVCWSVNPNPTINDFITSDGTGPNVFTSIMTGLSPSTTYYVRAYATNQTATNYGPTLTFTTSGVALPEVTTNPVTSITSTGGTTGGNVLSNGGIPLIERGVVWSTSINPTIANNKIVASGTTTGTFSSIITGLLPGTTYYVRAYATSSSGTGYGNQQTFTTSGSIPVLSTQSITSITSSSATSGGNITSTGGLPISQRGIIWSTSPNPNISLGTKTQLGSGTVGAFTSNLSGLSASTLYYVRAYATNSAGTGYGNELTFTSSPSGVGTCAITGLVATTANKIESFSFNINPSCTTYVVNVCRYGYTNPLVTPGPENPLDRTTLPTACAVRNNNTGQSFLTPTASEISAGVVTRVMSPQPAITGFWYSVKVTCNGSCTGNKTTMSNYIFNAP